MYAEVAGHPTKPTPEVQAAISESVAAGGAIAGVLFKLGLVDRVLNLAGEAVWWGVRNPADHL